MRISILILLSILFSGCITKEMYVPSDGGVKSITYEGVDGKFIPDYTFEKLINRYIEWEYYHKKYGPIN